MKEVSLRTAENLNEVNSKDFDCEAKSLLGHVSKSFQKDLEVLEAEVDLIDHARDMLKGKSKMASSVYRLPKSSFSHVTDANPRKSLSKSPEKKTREKSRTKSSVIARVEISSSENEETGDKENRQIPPKSNQNRTNGRKAEVSERPGPSGIKNKKSPVKKSGKRSRFRLSSSSDEDYGEPRAKSTQLPKRSLI